MTSRKIFSTLFGLILTSVICIADDLPTIKADYKAADIKLNELYNKAKNTLGKEDFENLRKDQKDWLYHLSSYTGSIAMQESESSKAGGKRIAGYVTDE